MIKLTWLDSTVKEYSDESDTFSLIICTGIELPILVKFHENVELKMVKEVTEY
jgi:hypothetical protein